MRNRALSAVAAGLAIIAAFAANVAAQAEEIKVLCTIGVKPALPDVVAEFERATGHKVSIVWGNAATLKSRYLEGEQADVAVLTAAAIDDLIKAGKVAGGRVDLARSGMGLAVKAGAPKPDISSPEALKRTLLAAKSVGYSTQGASGIYFATVIERLGIAAEVKAKHKDTPGAVGELVAAGEAEIGVQQIPELAAVPGLGRFPATFKSSPCFRQRSTRKPRTTRPPRPSSNSSRPRLRLLPTKRRVSIQAEATRCQVCRLAHSSLRAA
jgi:molybdate transport system substrate-binding protein